MAELTRAQIQELRRALNQASAVLEAAISLAAPDQVLEGRLRETRLRLNDERQYLDAQLAQFPDLPKAARSY